MIESDRFACIRHTVEQRKNGLQVNIWRAEKKNHEEGKTGWGKVLDLLETLQYGYYLVNEMNDEIGIKVIWKDVYTTL